jgi:hypothetical protein
MPTRIDPSSTIKSLYRTYQHPELNYLPITVQNMCMEDLRDAARLRVPDMNWNYATLLLPPYSRLEGTVANLKVFIKDKDRLANISGSRSTETK